MAPHFALCRSSLRQGYTNVHGPNQGSHRLFVTSEGAFSNRYSRRKEITLAAEIRPFAEKSMTDSNPGFVRFP